MSNKVETEQLTFDLGHRTSFREEDFIVTEGNRLAFEHVLAFPLWPGPLTLITGPEKSGKTHLARIWAKRAGAVAPGAGDIEQMAASADTCPVVLDDVERRGFEETHLFHLLNQSMRAGRAVLMTARAPVPEWPFLTDDVKSRARLAAHFSVLAADDLQLCQMFAKLFGDRQIVVDPKTITYLVARMERSPAEVVALVDVMDRLALKKNKPVGLKIAAEALAERAGKAGRGTETKE